MNVALVTNMIPPYREPLFNAIGQRVDLSVIISGTTEHNRQWKPWDDSINSTFKTVVLKGMRLKRKEGHSPVQTDLFKALRRISPDVIINAEFSINSLFGTIYAKRHKKRAVLWSEATGHSERNNSWLREAYRKQLVKFHHAAVVPGNETKAYMTSLGFAPDDCHVAKNAIEDITKRDDFATFKDKADCLRTEFSGITLIYSGRLIELKGIPYLLSAYANVKKNHNVRLFIMGSGPSEIQLRRQVQEQGIKDVSFLGFMDESNKWIYYLASDIFIFPTTQDVWGLVVNEAMLCGLPVVCSKYAGCCSDLIEDGKTGYAIDPHDTDHFTEAICKLVTDDELRNKMSKNARQKAYEYNIEESANGFIRAIGI